MPDVGLCWPLVVVVGLLIVVCVLIPLVLIGTVSGLLGVVSGIRYGDWRGSVTGALGLVLIAFGVWVIVSNMMRF